MPKGNRIICRECLYWDRLKICLHPAYFMQPIRIRNGQTAPDLCPRRQKGKKNAEVHGE